MNPIRLTELKELAESTTLNSLARRASALLRGLRECLEEIERLQEQP